MRDMYAYFKVLVLVLVALNTYASPSPSSYPSPYPAPPPSSAPSYSYPPSYPSSSSYNVRRAAKLDVKRMVLYSPVTPGTSPKWNMYGEDLKGMHDLHLGMMKNMGIQYIQLSGVTLENNNAFLTNVHKHNISAVATFSLHKYGAHMNYWNQQDVLVEMKDELSTFVKHHRNSSAIIGYCLGDIYEEDAFKTFLEGNSRESVYTIYTSFAGLYQALLETVYTLDSTRPVGISTVIDSLWNDVKFPIFRQVNFDFWLLNVMGLDDTSVDSILRNMNAPTALNTTVSATVNLNKQIILQFASSAWSYTSQNVSAVQQTDYYKLVQVVADRWQVGMCYVEFIDGWYRKMGNCPHDKSHAIHSSCGGYGDNGPSNNGNLTFEYIGIEYLGLMSVSTHFWRTCNRIRPILFEFVGKNASELHYSENVQYCTPLWTPTIQMSTKKLALLLVPVIIFFIVSIFLIIKNCMRCCSPKQYDPVSDNDSSAAVLEELPNRHLYHYRLKENIGMGGDRKGKARVEESSNMEPENGTYAWVVDGSAYIRDVSQCVIAIGENPEPPSENTYLKTSTSSMGSRQDYVEPLKEDGWWVVHATVQATNTGRVGGTIKPRTPLSRSSVNQEAPKDEYDDSQNEEPAQEPAQEPQIHPHGTQDEGEAQSRQIRSLSHCKSQPAISNSPRNPQISLTHSLPVEQHNLPDLNNPQVPQKPQFNADEKRKAMIEQQHRIEDKINEEQRPEQVQYLAHNISVEVKCPRGKFMSQRDCEIYVNNYVLNAAERVNQMFISYIASSSKPIEELKQNLQHLLLEEKYNKWYGMRMQSGCNVEEQRIPYDPFYEWFLYVLLGDMASFTRQSGNRIAQLYHNSWRTEYKIVLDMEELHAGIQYMPEFINQDDLDDKGLQNYREGEKGSKEDQVKQDKRKTWQELPGPLALFNIWQVYGGITVFLYVLFSASAYTRLLIERNAEVAGDFAKHAMAVCVYCHFIMEVLTFLITIYQNWHSRISFLFKRHVLRSIVSVVLTALPLAVWFYMQNVLYTVVCQMIYFVVFAVWRYSVKKRPYRLAHLFVVLTMFTSFWFAYYIMKILTAMYGRESSLCAVACDFFPPYMHGGSIWIFWGTNYYHSNVCYSCHMGILSAYTLAYISAYISAFLSYVFMQSVCSYFHAVSRVEDVQDRSSKLLVRDMNEALEKIIKSSREAEPQAENSGANADAPDASASCNTTKMYPLSVKEQCNKCWNYILEDLHIADFLSFEEMGRLYKQVSKEKYGAEEEIRFDGIVDEAAEALRFFCESIIKLAENPVDIRHIHGLSQLVVCYSETIISEKDKILSKLKGESFSLLDKLIITHAEEWENLKKRLKVSNLKEKFEDGHLEEPVAYEVRLWASYRLQTVARTMRGALAIHRAYKGLGFDSKNFVELIVSYQLYGAEDGAAKRKDMDYILFERADNRDFRIKLVYDEVIVKDRRFNTVIKQRNFDKPGELEVIRLPRFYPVVKTVKGRPALKTQGKAGNQLLGLCAVGFLIIQVWDANMDSYLMEGVKIPIVLNKHFRNLEDGVPRIVGHGEYIYTAAGSLVGAVTASAESTFGTLVQRFLAFQGVRLHYGHPDFIQFVTAAADSSLSGGAAIINVAEDIARGMKTMRNRQISVHEDLIQVGKGRENNFFAYSAFMKKIGMSSVSMIRGRTFNDTLCDLNYAELYVFFCSLSGFYFMHLLASLGLAVYMFTMLVLGLGNIPLPVLSDLHSPLSIEWMVTMGMINMVPFLFEQLLERGIYGLLRVLYNFPLSTLFYVPQNQVLVEGVKSSFCTGIATYMDTGRPDPFVKNTFRKLYMGLASILYVPAIRLILLYVWYALTVVNNGGVLPMFNALLMCTLFVLSPVIFNPFPSFLYVLQSGNEFVGWIFAKSLTPSDIIHKINYGKTDDLPSMMDYCYNEVGRMLLLRSSVFMQLVYDLFMLTVLSLLCFSNVWRQFHFMAVMIFIHLNLAYAKRKLPTNIVNYFWALFPLAWFVLYPLIVHEPVWSLDRVLLFTIYVFMSETVLLILRLCVYRVFKAELLLHIYTFTFEYNVQIWISIVVVVSQLILSLVMVLFEHFVPLHSVALFNKNFLHPQKKLDETTKDGYVN